MSSDHDAKVARARHVAERIDFAIPTEHESDYVQLLDSTEKICQHILSLPDYKPEPDPAYPRSNVRFLEPEENPSKAWAARCDIGDALDSNGKLLSGKTVIFKDTVCVAGVPLRLGTNAFEGYVPDVDATVVTRILQNGGHISGKAACENFSHGPVSSSSPYGPIDNPHAKGFSAGGSSSGCGALIGSGEIDMGIGGDQGGSIRIPACFCGHVGLKPTFGLLPYTGVISTDSGVDTVGPMAQNVLDTAKLLQATAGYDGIDDRQLGAPLPNALPDYVGAVETATLKGVKIGVIKEAMAFSGLDPNVVAVFNLAVDRLKAAGATIYSVEIPTFPLTSELLHVGNKMAGGPTRRGRASGRRGLYLNDFFEQLLPWTPEKYERAKYYVTGSAMSAEFAWENYPTAYGRAINLCRKMQHEFDAVLEKYDVLISPTCPAPANRHFPKDGTPLVWAKHTAGITAFTATANLTGHPAISVPMGTVSPVPRDISSAEDADAHLPVGLMITGRLFDDAKVLAVARGFEKTADWHEVHVGKSR